MITCIGLDLAWSPRNPTGAAVIVGTAAGGTLHDSAHLGSDDELLAYIEQHARTEPVLVAVDAPLKVPNQHGRRPAEAKIGRVFGPYQAGALPANRQRLARSGVVRGEALLAALEARGFVAAPAIEAGAAARLVTEVYPHAAMVALFGLPRTLKYKARGGRSRAVRLDAWKHYQQHMLNLAHADPPLHGHAALLAQPVATLRGQQLKAYEDRIDALLCAYIALYAYRWGTARCRTFGTLAEGWIFTPALPTTSHS